MPRQERGTITVLGWVVFTALAAGAVTFVVQNPYALLPVVLLIAGCAAWNRAYGTRMQQRITGRETDVCEFARSFDRRKTDPWLIRAVWDEFTDYLKGIRDPFPLRSTDRIKEDLEIDLEDVEDMVIQIADRAGYSLSSCKENPHYASIETVGDIGSVPLIVKK